MSSDGKKSAREGDTGRPATSARPPRQGQSGSPAVGDRRPPRLRNLAALLERENVEFVLVLAGAKMAHLEAALSHGGQDSKTFDVGDDGCLVILKLSDNPAGVGDGFSEVRLP